MIGINLIAFIFFIFCWQILPIILRIFIKAKALGMTYVMREHSFFWMKISLQREDRAVDILNITNFLRTVYFFASTSILIVAALVPLLRYAEGLEDFLNRMPLISSYLFTSQLSVSIIELKIFLLIFLFSYAFFKSTWSMRQYNYASVLILSAPICTSKTKELDIYAQRNSRILANATRHSRMGMHSYYYSVAVLSWILSAEIFIIVTLFVTFVIIRREFFSKASDIVSSEFFYKV